MTDQDHIEWPREIWMGEREKHDQGVVTAVLSEHATVARWEGDKERDREFHRYVDADIHESAVRYYRVRLATAEAARVSSSGIDAIAAERQRQVEAEGWTPEHDDTHTNGAMAAAAAAYAFSAFTNTTYRAYAAEPIGFWPWDEEWWTPKDPRSDLVRAGALIAAEIDRLDRAIERGT